MLTAGLKPDVDDDLRVFPRAPHLLFLGASLMARQLAPFASTPPSPDAPSGSTLFVAWLSWRKGPLGTGAKQETSPRERMSNATITTWYPRVSCVEPFHEEVTSLVEVSFQNQLDQDDCAVPAEQDGNKERRASEAILVSIRSHATHLPMRIQAA